VFSQVVFSFQPGGGWVVVRGWPVSSLDLAVFQGVVLSLVSTLAVGLLSGSEEKILVFLVTRFQEPTLISPLPLFWLGFFASGVKRLLDPSGMCLQGWFRLFFLFFLWSCGVGLTGFLGFVVLD